jgi:hypothetical protein
MSSIAPGQGGGNSLAYVYDGTTASRRADGAFPVSLKADNATLPSSHPLIAFRGIQAED